MIVPRVQTKDFTIETGVANKPPKRVKGVLTVRLIWTQTRRNGSPEFWSCLSSMRVLRMLRSLQAAYLVNEAITCAICGTSKEAMLYRR